MQKGSFDVDFMSLKLFAMELNSLMDTCRKLSRCCWFEVLVSNVRSKEVIYKRVGYPQSQSLFKKNNAKLKKHAYYVEYHLSSPY